MNECLLLAETKKIWQSNMFSREKEFSKVMIPPLYFLLCIIYQYSAHNYLPLSQIFLPNYFYLGHILVSLGILINLWSFILFKIYQTTIKPYKQPTELVRKGMFRVSRNPMYLGMFLMLTGIAIKLGSITPFVGPIVFLLIINTLIIPREEYKMERLFGDSYLEYKNSVRRWI